MDDAQLAGRIGTHLRSNVVGYVAVFIAAVGLPTAWATGRNSVGATQIKQDAVGHVEMKDNAIGPPEVMRNAIGNSEMRDRAVGSPEVINGSLLGQDFAPGQLPTGARGPQGEQGPQGERGLQGLAGSPGAPGATNVTVRSLPTTHAECLPGERATGGGGTAGGDDFLYSSTPSPSASGSTPTGWDALNRDVPGAGTGDNLTNSTTTYVVCASP